MKLQSLPMWAKLTISGATVAGTVAGGLAVAGAATSIAPGTIHGCVYTHSNRTLERVYLSPTNGTTCPSNSFLVTWNQKGPAGPAGPTGPQGPAGTNTVVSADMTAGSIPTGGSFLSNAVEVATLNLQAGKYLVSADAKATPNVSGDTAQIYPQFFVYNQVKNAAFTGDEFNVGAGALEPDGTNHDSYYSGSGVVVVPAAGETLHVYAFGYDSDKGAGSYTLDSGSITAVQLGG